jgi:hypothetical protein
LDTSIRGKVNYQNRQVLVTSYKASVVAVNVEVLAPKCSTFYRAAENEQIIFCFKVLPIVAMPSSSALLANFWRSFVLSEILRILLEYNCACSFRQLGLPDGFFSNQKSQFG